MSMYMAKLIELTQQKEVRLTLALLCSLAIVGAGWFSFQWYRVYQGQRAQKILSDCIDEYINAQSRHQLWPEVQLMNELAYDQVGGSALGPFFLMMQAQALAEQGKLSDALPLFDQALESLKKDSPYRSWYETTKYVVLLGCQEQSLVEQGLDGLKELAADEQNVFRDSALYHLGEWYWLQDDRAQAKLFWQQLIEDDQRFVGSPWVALAQEQMASFA